jgi:hypothetical protein
MISPSGERHAAGAGVGLRPAGLSSAGAGVLTRPRKFPCLHDHDHEPTPCASRASSSVARVFAGGKALPRGSSGRATTASSCAIPGTAGTRGSERGSTRPCALCRATRWRPRCSRCAASIGSTALCCSSGIEPTGFRFHYWPALSSRAGWIAVMGVLAGNFVGCSCCIRVMSSTRQWIKATIHVACTLAACVATMRTPSITCLGTKVVLLWLHAVEFRPATKTIETSFSVQLVGMSARQSNQHLNSKAAAHLGGGGGKLHPLRSERPIGSW